MNGMKLNFTTLLLGHNETHLFVRFNLNQIFYHEVKPLRYCRTNFPQVKVDGADDCSVMDDAHKHYSKRRPADEVKVILPLT